MKKRIWLYFLIGLFVMAVVTMVVVSNYAYIFIQPQKTDLQYYLELTPENNYYSSGECIPDAQTAGRVGSIIVDNMCNKGVFNIGFTTVEYDDTNRLWKIDKSYFFSQGGFVVIKQDTGEIIRALLNK